jgi:threonine/homoserine/homoserine lactone efflux protein
MMSADRLLAFAAVSFLLIIIPGPSVLFVVGRALAHGRNVALITVAGNALGAYVLVAAVALGVGAVLERSVVVFTVLKLAGAAYLVHLGLKAWRQRGSLRAAVAGVGAGAATGAAHGRLRTFGEGFAVGVTNPKTLVFFAAVLPQFVDRGHGHAAAQMLLLGLVFNLIALVSDSVWGMTAAGARDWFARSPRRLSMVGGAGGLSMIGLGVAIAVTGNKD